MPPGQVPSGPGCRGYHPARSPQAQGVGVLIYVASSSMPLKTFKGHHSAHLLPSDCPPPPCFVHFCMQECSAPKDLGRASTGAREQQRLERMAYGGGGRGGRGGGAGCGGGRQRSCARAGGHCWWQGKCLPMSMHVMGCWAYAHAREQGWWAHAHARL